MEHSSEHRSFYRALQERPDLGPDALSRVSKRMRDLMDGYVELLQGTVDRGIRKGELRPIDVHRGDRVLFSKSAGTEIELDGEEHLILREDAILAVLEAEARAMAAKEVRFHRTAQVTSKGSSGMAKRAR